MMTSAPTNPYEVPPYQVQPLISSVLERGAPTAGASPQVTCAQAIGEFLCMQLFASLMALQQGQKYTWVAQTASYYGSPCKWTIQIKWVSVIIMR